MSVSCGDHLPCLLAISTIASLILAPSLLLVVYLCLMILSLFYVMSTSLFKRFCKGRTVVPESDGQVEVGHEAEAEVEVEVEVDGGRIQDLQPSPSGDMV